jgi:hypothetical protein
MPYQAHLYRATIALNKTAKPWGIRILSPVLLREKLYCHLVSLPYSESSSDKKFS